MERLRRNIITTLIIPVVFLAVAEGKDPGINAFFNGDYKKAGDYYESRLKKDAGNEKVMYNAGTAALAQKDLEKANSLLMQSLAAEDKAQLAKAHYNLGQLALQEQDAGQALEHFKKSMIYDPDDPNAKIMYEHLQRMQQQQQQQQQDQDQQQQGQDQQDQEKQDQEQKDGQQDQQQQDKQDQEQVEQDQNRDAQQQESQLSEEDLKPRDLSKEQAANILNAMKEDEKESMKKLILSKAKGKKIKRSKEW